MAEVARRFWWLVCVVACHSAPATVDTCHHDGSAQCFGEPCGWTAAIAWACKSNDSDLHAAVCKDGSGRTLTSLTNGFGYWYDAKGILVGSWIVSDVVPSTCPTEYWGTQLACDLTPIDLACQNTPP